MKIWRWGTGILLLVMVLLGMRLWPGVCSEVMNAAAMSRETLRVGFFAFDGYHMMDSEGRRSGYGYEFLQLLARYTNWRYDYIGYDKSWKDMQDMLRSGEIDLLTSAQKTPEREAEFAFSERSIGLGAAILTVKAGDSRFVPNDYRSYDGMRVGLLQGNKRNEDFQKFADSQGFSYQPVYFDSVTELTAALQAGDRIDAIVTSNLRLIKNEWVLNQFNPVPIYVMVRKSDSSLLYAVDRSIELLDIYSPEWRSELHTKYYSMDDGSNVSFSAEERGYLQELQDRQEVLKVAMDPAAAPYSYFDAQGNPQGIFPELFAEIAKRAGIPYRILPVSSREEYRQMISRDAVDIDLGALFDYSLAEQSGFELTRPFISTFLAQLSRSDFSGTPASIAVSHDGLSHILDKSGIFRGKEVYVLPTDQDCVDGVLAGKYDAAWLLTYTAQKYLREDSHSRLRLSAMPKSDIGFSLGVSVDNDYRLLSILNKSVESMNDTDIPQQVILHYVSGIPAMEFSLERYVYSHPQWFAAAASLLVALLAALLIIIQRAGAARRDRDRRLELERFVGYVCRANDFVLECDMDQRRCLRYRLDNGVVIRETMDHDMGFFKKNVHPDDAGPILSALEGEALRKLIREEGEYYFECRCRDEAGRYRWYAFTIQGIPRTKLHPYAFILFRRDIDAVKRTEETKKQALKDALEAAQRASSAKGNFLSSMSHEIRTPLNAIIGYLTLAGLPDIPMEQIRYYLAQGEAASQHLLQIINEILDISAIESGHFKIAREPFSIVRQLNLIKSIFMERARAKGLKFRVDAANLPDNWLLGDGLRVNQILLNLLSNAMKFTPSGGQVSLQVESSPMEGRRQLLKFTVKDTGVGMSEEFLSRIFTPFEQESAHTAEHFGGTGLGLSITRNLIHLMDGSIEVKSQQKKGSVFVVTLPFAVTAAASMEVPRTALEDRAVPADEAAMDADAGWLQGIHVLLAEDNELNREIAVAMLEHLGMKVTTAENGREAVEKFLAAPEGTYQYILMDLQMPVLDGYEATRQIRAVEHPEAKRICIIAVTADVFPEDIARASACGMDDYISKPIDYKRLLSIMKKRL